jgi:GH18 family chitinase
MTSAQLPPAVKQASEAVEEFQSPHAVVPALVNARSATTNLGQLRENARACVYSFLYGSIWRLTDGQVLPEDLNLSGFTHVNFAFAFFDPGTFQIAPMDSNSGTLLHRFTALKDKYNGLQTWISVGG